MASATPAEISVFALDFVGFPLLHIAFLNHIHAVDFFTEANHHVLHICHPPFNLAQSIPHFVLRDTFFSRYGRFQFEIIQ